MPAFVITRRIAFGGNDIDYAKLKDDIQPDDFDHVLHTTKAGDTIAYKRVTQQVWHEDIICTEANTVFIRVWISARSTVVFTPDLIGDAGTTHNVTIMNRTFPFFHWAAGKFRATLILRKQ